MATVLKQGSRGALVERWQAFLIQAGLGPLEIDGIFGPATRTATEAFQQTAGLGVDGIVGNRTFGAAMSIGFDLIGDSDDSSEFGPNFPPEPAFRPIVGDAARQELFGPLAFEPAPRPDNPEAIRITNDWADRNIVRVTVPQLTRFEFSGPNGEISFHRKAADQVVALFQAWEDAGLADLILTYAGSWAPRFIRGSRRTLSNHAFGTAFDINAGWNGLGREPARVGRTGSVRKLVPLAHQHGFYWGGHFSRRDGMHFEIANLQD